MPLNKKFMAGVISVTFTCYMSTADAANVVLHEKIFGLTIGGTRVIYNEGAPTTSFWIKNEKEYPILVQSKVIAEDKKSKAPFIITPPVLRVDSGIQTRLRIIPTGKLYNEDTESLYWICVKGVPPINISTSQNEVRSKSSTGIGINVTTNSCIKLIYRPEKVDTTISDAIKKLEIKTDGEKLSIINNSPLYINIAEIKLERREITIPNGYIKPFSNETIKIKVNKGEAVNLIILDDIGAEIKSSKHIS